jgi:hypothetical protein
VSCFFLLRFRVSILITDIFPFCRSPFPWFYFVFFMVMIIHRTTRDVARCRRKYGEAWTRYEKEVPYLFVPVSFPFVLDPWAVLCVPYADIFLAVYHLSRISG